MTAQWRVNLSSAGAAEKYISSLPQPPGMAMKVEADTELDHVNVELMAEKESAAKQQVVNSIAYSPGKALFQTALMLWFSGSSIQIFSIYSTFNALSGPVKGIINTEAAFSRFSNEKGVDTSVAKLIYVALQLVALGIGMYKCHTMGLLPVTSVDWLWQLPEKVIRETAGIPV